jgi:hypothetical protein
VHKIIIYISFIYLFFVELLIQVGILPSKANLLIDVLSLIVMVIVVINFVIYKKFNIPFKYIYLFIMTLVLFIASSFVNQLSASSIVLGVRQYLKFLPFFILPLIREFSIADLKRVLKLLTGILLIQLPITFIQRFVIYRGYATGDVVAGSVKHSGALSVILIFAIVMIYSLYLKKEIPFKVFVCLVLALFIPTAINETKVTFILLPLAIILPVFLFDTKNLIVKFRKIISYSVMAIFLLIGFVYTYNILYGEQHGRSLFEYFMREKEGRGYLYHKDYQLSDVQNEKEVGRIDSIVLAYEYLSKDPIALFFGTGPGTVNPKSIKFLRVEDYKLNKYNPDTSTVSMLLWELGILSIIIFFMAICFIFFDTYRLKKYEKSIGSLGLGWACVSVLLLPVTLYINVLYLDVINMPFWFLSGVFISKTKKKATVDISNEQNL